MLCVDAYPQHFTNCYKEFMDVGKWEQPKYVPACLLSQLEIFVWKKNDWERDEGKEVANFLPSYVLTMTRMYVDYNATRIPL